MSRSSRRTGVITAILTGRGFNQVSPEKSHGFICPDDGGEDLFFHKSMVTTGSIEDLSPGDRVSYETIPGKLDQAGNPLGDRAVKVRKEF